MAVKKSRTMCKATEGKNSLLKNFGGSKGECLCQENELTGKRVGTET